MSAVKAKWKEATAGRDSEIPLVAKLLDGADVRDALWRAQSRCRVTSELLAQKHKERGPKVKGGSRGKSSEDQRLAPHDGVLERRVYAARWRR
jgi:hypothetical protein